jgi:hypothetical protein
VEVAAADSTALEQAAIAVAEAEEDLDTPRLQAQVAHPRAADARQPRLMAADRADRDSADPAAALERRDRGSGLGDPRPVDGVEDRVPAAYLNQDAARNLAQALQAGGRAAEVPGEMETRLTRATSGAAVVISNAGTSTTGFGSSTVLPPGSSSERGRSAIRRSTVTTRRIIGTAFLTSTDLMSL